MPTPQEEPNQRLCINCLELKPPTEFRRRGKNNDQRVSQCRQCHNTAELQRRHRKRSANRDRQMQKLATSIRQCRNAKRLQTLLHTGIMAAGGYTALLQNWYETIQHEVDRRERPAQLMRFYSTIMQGLIRSEHPGK